jgi:hypothetical protein
MTAIAIPTEAPAAPVLPPPGIYRDIPFSVYRSWPAVNKSSLDHIQERSPLHCKFRMDNPEDETEALRIGHGYHTLALEGEDKYASEFLIASACRATVKSTGRPCENSGSLLGPDGLFYCRTKGHAPAGSAEPDNVITADQDATIRATLAGTLRCSGAREFIESPGDNELSIIWIDPETGLPCKARIDMVRAGWNSIGDLKTTEDASKDGFTRSIDKYGYQRQGAFYLRGAKAVGIDCEYFSIIPTEKSAQHAAAAYKLMGDAIGAGDEQIGKLLRIYAKCKSTGHWWGYSEGFEDISISQWEMRKIVEGANA